MTFLAAVPRALRVAILTLTTLAAAVAPVHAAKQAASGGGKDRTPPTIAIGAPAAASMATGDLSAAGSAADAGGLARVELSIDGGAPRAASGTTSWSATIDTRAYANGSHTLTARAVDRAGLSSVATVTFSVSNSAQSADVTAPSLSIASPSAGATVPRQIAVSGSANDNAMLAAVEVRLDGGTYQSATGTSSWSTTLDASAVSTGDHTITARATDSAGNVTATSVQVQISDNQIQAPEQAPGTICGYAFQENDRDGAFESGEQALAGAYVYSYTSSGLYLANAQTDASGWYCFTGLADATYIIEIAPISWNELRMDWVPDTTGSVHPKMTVRLASRARADFGTRRILRSTDPAAPISSHTGANGLKVRSYNDAVTAQEVYERLMQGTLVGAEAQRITIRLDITAGGITNSMMVERNGVPSEYSATSSLSWTGWLRGEGQLFHEYGHAWSGFYAFMVQNDRTLSAYLEARGLAGDPRIGSTYSWRPDEMIAEDYSQLFGTPSAQATGQANRDIPLAKDVPGLREFLSTTFMQPPAG